MMLKGEVVKVIGPVDFRDVVIRDPHERMIRFRFVVDEQVASEGLADSLRQCLRIHRLLFIYYGHVVRVDGAASVAEYGPTFMHVPMVVLSYPDRPAREITQFELDLEQHLEEVRAMGVTSWYLTVGADVLRASASLIRGTIGALASAPIGKACKAVLHEIVMFSDPPVRPMAVDFPFPLIDGHYPEMLRTLSDALGRVVVSEAEVRASGWKPTPPEPDTTGWLTVSQVYARYGILPGTITKLANKSVITARGRFKKRRIDPATVDEYIARRDKRDGSA